MRFDNPRMSPTPSTENNASAKPRPLKETLWNWLGVLFYLTCAVGAVYHFVLPYI